MIVESNEEGKKIIGKTISKAWIDGGTVYIEFTDGAVLDYFASDGGYSCWDLVDKNGKYL
jgi:hypothetical protein